MKKKEIVDAISDYYAFLLMFKNENETLQNVELRLNNSESFYKGNSQNINWLSNTQKIITMILENKARDSETISGIWCYFGVAKYNDAYYHIFLDLETMTPQYVNPLEYREFCEINPVIVIDEIIRMYKYPNKISKLKVFLEFRNLYLSDIARISMGLNLDEIDIKTFGNHYDSIVSKYKKIGDTTIKNFKNSIKGR